MNENLPSTIQEQHALQQAPFGRTMSPMGSINQGAVAIEQERAIAEAQGQLTLAKKFPRSVSAAITEFLDTCNSSAFAATAFYSVPNRGSGPSIRFAEEAARCYGNFVYGHRELSRGDGKSEIEVYAWDMEKNNRSSRQITVMHVVDTKNGPKKLIDQADIDNKIANVASKQMRGRILALMPKHMIAAGVEAAKRTLAGGGEKPVSERIIAMAAAFGRFGVTNDMLAAYLDHPVDTTTVDELADLMGVFNAIKDGAKASEFFGNKEREDAAASTAASISDRAKAGAAAAAKAAPPEVKKVAQPAQKNSNPAQSESKAVKTNQAAVSQKAPEPEPEVQANDEHEPPPPSDGAEDDVF